MRTIRSAALALALSAAALAAVPDKDADDAIAAFKKAYATKEDSARVAAVAALAKVQHKHVVDALAKPLLHDPAAAVRKAAAKGIGGIFEPNAATVLAKCLDEVADRDVVLAVISALVETDSDVAAETLTGFLSAKKRWAWGRQTKMSEDSATVDVDSALTSAALAGIKKIGSPRAVDALLDFLADEENNRSARARLVDPLARQAERALEAITGERKSGASEWRSWWMDAKEKKKVHRFYRCEGNGKPFERTGTAACPYDGAANPKCGFFSKTRLEGAPAPEPEKPARRGKKE